MERGTARPRPDVGCGSPDGTTDDPAHSERRLTRHPLREQPQTRGMSLLWSPSSNRAIGTVSDRRRCNRHRQYCSSCCANVARGARADALPAWKTAKRRAKPPTTPYTPAVLRQKVRLPGMSVSTSLAADPIGPCNGVHPRLSDRPLNRNRHIRRTPANWGQARTAHRRVRRSRELNEGVREREGDSRRDHQARDIEAGAVTVFPQGR